MESDDTHYEVGYGKPPAGTRFAKGRSGNPGGRPKVKMTLAEALGDALDEKLSIKVKGKNRRVTVREVIVNRLAHKAAEGNLAAIKQIESIEARVRVAGSVAPATPVFQEFDVTLDLEEAPVMRPDFVGRVEVLLGQHAEALKSDAHDGFRDKCQRLLQLRDEILAEAAHLFPGSLDDLTE